ncbi:MAG: hypothetical protein JNM93_01715 [Bacteriovoracaceae bacterium]|nr:hypothetical protein [Bacteriovoracaceae bacterium]
MKNDSKPVIVAKIDAKKVKYIKPKELVIDFANEIDIWAKMQFKSRKQVQQLQKNSNFEENEEGVQNANKIVYAIRDKLED